MYLKNVLQTGTKSNSAESSTLHEATTRPKQTHTDFCVVTQTAVLLWAYTRKAFTAQYSIFSREALQNGIFIYFLIRDTRFPTILTADGTRLFKLVPMPMLVRS